ncbi:hypothetical protein CCY01nite_07300 [Chitinophaga cymbidii]|uniref:Uncharacterized protein n=1 Tax=Chitinophaga cymbidii TaxID=1096750 RepID=A0A512RFJ2_9BACT|nr:hypothetical protein CCY01nite_07300 [Chitinophaga cymbidii]
MINATVNQSAIVRNFRASVSRRFAAAEPIVISTTDKVINIIWISPKNNRSNSRTASLKFDLKYAINGLEK